MSDPRYTDPRYSGSRWSDPGGRSSDNASGTWGWIAGIVVLALIALFLIVGGKGVKDNTASNNPPTPGSTGSAAMPRGPAPSTTGMGTPLLAPARTAPPASGGSQ